MDNKTRMKIENIVRDMTVGDGVAALFSRSEIEKRLKRPLTDEEASFVGREWAKCIMCMACP